MTNPLLAVENLCTYFYTQAGIAKAVDEVSFTLEPGQIMALVGESGSGKSITAYSLMGLIDAPGKIVAGQIYFQGRDLRTVSRETLRDLRGNRIAMIFQDPMMTLNPVLRIDTQMLETIAAHQKISSKAAYALARDTLVRMGIAAPEERLQSYPHQFSGGMRQRIAIAIALLNQPDLIICDEPTTALDVTIQAQILFEMQKLCRESGTALLWITHDLSLMASLADQVSVMYAGRIVESGSVAQVIHTPRHPYTAGLIAATPAAAQLRGAQPGTPLAQIPGAMPSLLSLPSGCAFRPRCARASQACWQTPPFFDVGTAQQWRCFHAIA